MAFSCKIFLKNECDGCGRCEDWNHSFSRVRNPYEDDYGDPFEIDHDDER